MDTECCLGIPKCSETAFSTRVATPGGEQRRGVSHQLTSSVRGHCPVDYRWPLYGGRQPESLVYDVVLNLRVAFTLSLPTRSSSPSASAPTVFAACPVASFRRIYLPTPSHTATLQRRAATLLATVKRTASPDHPSPTLQHFDTAACIAPVY